MEVLVIDDDRANQFLISRLLNKVFSELKLSVAFNGEQGLELIEKAQKKFDIIFLDIYMPVLDGWEFLERSKKLPLEETKIVVMATNRLDTLKKKMTSHKFDLTYLPKPITEEKLRIITTI